VRSAFVFQALSLGVSIGILLVALLFLQTEDYLLWVLFTTIGSGLINLESALNTVSTRTISRAWIDKAPYAATVQLVGRSYTRFSTVGSIFMAVAGGLYLTTIDYGIHDYSWVIPWAIFCVAYFLYYLTSYRSCQLVAIGRISTFTGIGSLGRLANLVAAAALAWAGYGLMGLAVAVLLSFAVTGLMLERAGRQSIREAPGEWKIAPAALRISDLLRKSSYQAAFAILSYFLYRGVFLYLSTVMPSALDAASLGLAIQFFGFILLLAAVPLNMRIAPLIEAGRSGDPGKITVELGHLSKLVNLAFLAASAALILLGPEIFKLMPSLAATLPPRSTLTILAACFWVEVNLLVFVNLWLAIDRFEFVRLYMLSFAVAWAVSITLILTGHASPNLLLLAALAVQLLVAFPLIVHQVHRDLGVSPTAYVKSMWSAKLNLTAVF
jgi:hypothetical protein